METQKQQKYKSAVNWHDYILVVTNGVLGSDDVNSFIALAVTFTEQANSMWQQHKFFALYILIV